jgi:hypothetical protein
MAEIDLETLSTPEHGYTVDDSDDDDSVVLDRNGEHIDTWRERYPYDQATTRSGPGSTPCVTCLPNSTTTTRIATSWASRIR